MDLTDEQQAVLAAELGYSLPLTDAQLDDLEERYDRLGTVEAVIVEVLRWELRKLLNEPSSFSVAGVYSQSNGERIKALQEALAAAEAAAYAVTNGGNVASGELVRADRSGR